MNSNERTRLRESFTASGFKRTSFTDDLDSVGDYTETWKNEDGTEVAVKWAPRTVNPDLIVWQTPTETEPVNDAPGMYDEPDYGLGFGGFAESSRMAHEADVVPMTRFEESRPSVFAPFQHREVTITCRDGDGQTETLTGYPVDAWRFSPTALGVRVAFEPGGDRGDYIVLPDDASWKVETTDADSVYRHAPKVTV